ncbi:hypothetical protein LAZ67_7002795 [Cordylochernes scorpioides]|uniref:Uncharacterized protein n=1 Tax=Cordylochernes scorpioides TaxID=51811 RepID=A0ABY6KNJ1_9ARAC|nr:hypothetical protein LAZ67_7002795 [Cordylochernes scorpioides]
MTSKKDLKTLPKEEVVTGARVDISIIQEWRNLFERTVKLQNISENDALSMIPSIFKGKALEIYASMCQDVFTLDELHQAMNIFFPVSTSGLMRQFWTEKKLPSQPLMDYYFNKLKLAKILNISSEQTLEALSSNINAKLRPFLIAANPANLDMWIKIASSLEEGFRQEETSSPFNGPRYRWDFQNIDSRNAAPSQDSLPSGARPSREVGDRQETRRKQFYQDFRDTNILKFNNKRKTNRKNIRRPNLLGSRRSTDTFKDDKILTILSSASPRRKGRVSYHTWYCPHRYTDMVMVSRSMADDAPLTKEEEDAQLEYTDMVMVSRSMADDAPLTKGRGGRPVGLRIRICETLLSLPTSFTIFIKIIRSEFRVLEAQNFNILQRYIPLIIRTATDQSLQLDYERIRKSVLYSHYKYFHSSPTMECYLNDNIPLTLKRINVQNIRRPNLLGSTRSADTFKDDNILTILSSAPHRSQGRVSYHTWYCPHRYTDMVMVFRSMADDAPLTKEEEDAQLEYTDMVMVFRKMADDAPLTKEEEDTQLEATGQQIIAIAISTIHHYIISAIFTGGRGPEIGGFITPVSEDNSHVSTVTFCLLLAAPALAIYPSPYKFGYDVDDGYYNRHHHNDVYGAKTGSYGYTDGIYRHVSYVADGQGYRAYVSTNEPGTAPQDPADIKMYANVAGYQKPAYNKPEPSYNKPEPSYNKPEPSYNKPEPSYIKPKPSYYKTEPSYNNPKPDYNKPEPAYNKPEPSYPKPEITNNKY